MKLKVDKRESLKFKLVQMDPISPVSSNLEGHLQLLKETATYHFPDSNNNNSIRDILSFSQTNKNGWKMIHNALFNKLYDKRIIMKTYLEKHKNEQLNIAAEQITK